MPIYRQPWPPQPLDLEDTQTDADWLVDIGRSSSGMAATLYGYITGVEEVGADSPNPAPIAPGHGLRCHDHSGGEHGRPLFRTVWSQFMGQGDRWAAPDITTQPIYLFINETALIDGVERVSDEFASAPQAVYVPGCDQEVGAYANMGVAVVLSKVSPHSLLAADTLELRVENITTAHTVVFDITPNGTGDVYAESDKANSPTELLRMLPGAVNSVRCYVYCNLTGTGVARACVVDVHQLELGVYESL